MVIPIPEESLSTFRRGSGRAGIGARWDSARHLYRWPWAVARADGHEPEVVIL